MRASRSTCAALAVVGLGAGCELVDTIDGSTRQFRLTGESERSDRSGRTAGCSMDLLFDVEEPARTSRGATYVATFGGGLGRFVLEADGSGLGFLIDVHGAAIVERTFPDQLVITIPINDTTESRFYRELARLEGVVEGPHDGVGTWTCAPLDIDQDGYRDDAVSVPVEWTLTEE